MEDGMEWQGRWQHNRLLVRLSRDSRVSVSTQNEPRGGRDVRYIGFLHVGSPTLAFSPRSQPEHGSAGVMQGGGVVVLSIGIVDRSQPSYPGLPTS